MKEKVEDATLYRTVRINLSKSKEKYVLADLLKSPEAVQSGVLENDKIVAIDGQHISDFSAENINDILHEKLNEDQLTIVISRSKSKIGKPEMKPDVLESLDEMLELDSAIESAGDLLDVHRVKIDLNDSSYGFFLGEDHHIVTDIHPDKAAAKSGIQEGDRIIEIKGLNVENESHETVSKLLREGLTDKEIEISVVHSIEHTDGAYLNEAYENDADDL